MRSRLRSRHATHLPTTPASRRSRRPAASELIARHQWSCVRPIDRDCARAITMRRNHAFGVPRDLPPPGKTAPRSPLPTAVCSARPFLPRGGVGSGAGRAGGDRRPRRRNPVASNRVRVRPPSRGAVRETRRHYDRLCVWRTVRALGPRRARRAKRGPGVRRAERMATSRRAGALDAPIFGPPVNGGPSGATDAPATLGISPRP